MCSNIIFLVVYGSSRAFKTPAIKLLLVSGFLRERDVCDLLLESLFRDIYLHTLLVDHKFFLVVANTIKIPFLL